MQEIFKKARECKEFKNETFKISPSKIVNYYYPMDTQIDEEVLLKAGTRGNVIHGRIEEFLLTGNEMPYEIKNVQGYEMLEQKDLDAIETLWSSYIETKPLIIEDDNFACEVALETGKVRGIIDFFGMHNGEVAIVDHKTNSTFGEKEIAKATLQLNIYRLMIKANFNIDVDNLYIHHITKNKTKNRVKEIKLEIIEDSIVISKINDVFNYYENENAISGTNTLSKVEVPKNEEKGAKMENVFTGFKIENNINEQKKKLIMIMGEPKSGKTTFVNTLTDNKILFIECGYDNGYGVLKSNVDIVRGQVTNDIGNKLHSGTKLLNILKQINAKIDDYANIYEWLVIDPFNNIEEDVKNFIETIKGKQLSMQEWGIIGKVYEDLKQELMIINQKINICLLTHVKSLDHTDDLSGTTTLNIIPMMTENNGKKFTKVADLIGYTCISKNENNELGYGIIIGGHPTLPTGVRTSNDVEVTTKPIEPNYKKIESMLWS